MSKRCIACCSTCRRTNLQHIEVVELGPNSTWIQNTIACNPTNASATMVTSLSSAVAVTADVPSTLHCLTRQTMLQLLNSITRTHVGGSSHVHVCASLKLAGELHSPVNYTGDRIRYIVTAEKYTKVHKRKLLRIAWFCIKSKCKVVLHYTRKDYFCWAKKWRHERENRCLPLSHASKLSARVCLLLNFCDELRQTHNLCSRGRN